MEKTELNTTVNEELQEDYAGEHVSVIDFKMITFSLAEKDYAIDIMKVKEIAKANNFTYVPNTAPFVLGVYNLRGDIIPIIDLRIFFNIPIKQRAKDTIESMVIINVDDQIFGIVVDRIDKVVGVSKTAIQSPHPIFGDINIKYIYGVVENAGQLYILLDVDRIFSTRTITETKNMAVEEEAPLPAAAAMKTGTMDGTKSNDALDIRFIGDTLAAFDQFYASPINAVWLEKRYYEWRDTRVASDIQIQTEEQAREFLSTFLSPDTHRFWSDGYMNTVLAALPDSDAKIITVWNVGCNSGYETYSLAVLLKQKYPRATIRIYANDADLLAISNATMLTVPEEQLINRFKPYLVKGVNDTYSFNQEIKDMILFEYHDCLHQNTVPDVDIILARDVLSFIKTEKQNVLLEEFRDKLKTTGIVILGANEMMPKQSGWMRQIMGDITTFSRE